MDVVTGGAGFIGSHLVRRLLDNGRDVTVIDMMHTGNEKNLAGLTIKMIHGRSSEIARISGNVDVIYHLGIPSSSPMYRENPKLISLAIEDFMEVVEFARKHDSQLVLASTSSLYNGLEPPHREDMAIKPSDFYTEARLMMERLLAVYHSFYGMNAVALRFFSVYGEHESFKGNYANIVSQFIWRMMKGERPVIYGDGSQERDFIYVEDIVTALVKASAYNGYDVFNAGTGKSHSFNDVVNLINKMLGTNIRPVYVENPLKNYVFRTLADTSKAESKLGFKAEVSLEDGIKRVIDYNRRME